MTTITTIPANDRRESFIASAGQTVFPYDFPVYAAADLAVRRLRASVETVLAQDVDYTVTGAGLQAGGSITLTTPALAGDVITILSAQPAARLSAYSPAGDFRADAINADLNRIWIYLQQLTDLLTRGVRLPASDPPTDLQLPPAAARAGRFLAFDDAGAAIAAAGTSSVPVTPFAATLLDDTDGAAACATLGAFRASGGIITGDVAVTGALVPSSSFLRNRIINGDMRIDQRNAGAASANTINGYFLDRWAVFQSVTGKLIAQQNAGSVTPPSGFTNYLGVTSQSAYSVGSSDFYVIDQRVEGFNVSDLGWGTGSARPVTLSFWVRSSLTGTFGAVLRNASENRSYPFTYTISAANTWEYKTITIPGDTSGTWNTGNGIGIELLIGLGVGSTFSGTAGAWAGATFLGATGATSVVGTNGATFYLTGVQIEVGSAATPFERRQFGQELALCQRYFARSGSITVANQTASQVQCTGQGSFPVTMRASPTLSATDTTGLSVSENRELTLSVQVPAFQLRSTGTISGNAEL